MKLFVVFVIFCVTLSAVLAEFEYEEDDFGNEVGEQFEKRQGLCNVQSLIGELVLSLANIKYLLTEVA